VDGFAVHASLVGGSDSAHEHGTANNHRVGSASVSAALP
jgi:hypothetical protein